MRVRRASGKGRSRALTGAAVLASVAALLAAAPAPGAGGTSCPLTLDQQVKAVHAFKPIAAFVTREPRCFNCHGGVNPHIDGVGPDPGDPNAPVSTVAHGGGAQDRGERGFMAEGCENCHENMAPKRDGSPSKWFTAPAFLSFVGKDAPTLCKQFKRAAGSAEHFLGHLQDDNGADNFSQTAFLGNRGLNEEWYTKGSPPAPPSMTHAAVKRLGEAWIESMGGEFKGDESCGCEVKLQGEFTYTDSGQLGPFSDVLKLSGKLTWTLQEDGPQESAGNGARSLLFKPTAGEITVDLKFDNRGLEGKSFCAGGGTRTFPVERMHRSALRYMQLEILPEGGYTLMLAIPDRPDPFPEWRLDADCVWPNVTAEDEVPVHSIGMFLDEQRGTLDAGGGIVGQLSTPVRRGPRTITGSWSFKSPEG